MYNAATSHMREFLSSRFVEFPWQVKISDWEGNTYTTGGDEAHWSNQPLSIHLKTERAGKDLLSLNAMGVLERFLEGHVEIEGNIYLLPFISKYLKLETLKLWQAIPLLFSNTLFQSISRANVNVKSHYDIPQEALGTYLDRVYKSYSCGMFEKPEKLCREELLRVGQGEDDNFDSLEKAQWRKFKDAVDFINPNDGDTFLDVGCGYGGQLVVALENRPFGKVVGWTHSQNQVVEGAKLLSPFEASKWELNEGDYREDNRVYDHIASTGMISHVGPRGLVPYVKQIRKRIKIGGRYVHHALMTPYYPVPLNFTIGAVFNKKYVWPGFHWFTVAEHMRALERNGFEVVKAINLSPHYEKTTAAWYERLMANRDNMCRALGEPTFRAWRIFLAGSCGGFRTKSQQVYRIYCEAI